MSTAFQSRAEAAGRGAKTLGLRLVQRGYAFTLFVGDFVECRGDLGIIEAYLAVTYPRKSGDRSADPELTQ